MTVKSRKILFKIVNCEEFDIPQSECRAIIDIQRNENKWQVPEPWSGEITKSPVMFIGKNPSINLEEEYPTRYDDNWTKDFIEDFFTNRFGNGRKVWVKDGKRVLLKPKKNGKIDYFSIANWSKIMKLYSQITGKRINEIKLGLDYAITDIVHCKSEKGKAVTTKLIKKCAKTHLIDILDITKARLIIVLGNDAKSGVVSALEGIKLPLFKLYKHKYKQKEFYFLFMRHTNYWCEENEKEPSPKNLLDRGEMSLTDFEKIWEILCINPKEEYINWLREGKSECWY